MLRLRLTKQHHFFSRLIKLILNSEQTEVPIQKKSLLCRYIFMCRIIIIIRDVLFNAQLYYNGAIITASCKHFLIFYASVNDLKNTVNLRVF